MPQINILTNEVSPGGTGVSTGTGSAFVVGTTDQGPPLGGPAYVKTQALSDYVNAFGPRSSTSATLYDWLDQFFSDGGHVAYVARVTDNTATTAALTLSDAVPHPTVLVSAQTAGTAGNGTFITVLASTGSTFTANTASSTTLSVISSFAGIGPGTLVTGTGIPANTYIVSVNTGASTALLSNAATATATGVTITPGAVTVEVLDSVGDVLETHGPYFTTAQLHADTSSTLVNFAQSAGSGFTLNLPAAVASVPLTGGADASDLTDASHVATLASFPSTLGAGTVALPGKTSTTAWQGLLSHAQANNRFAALDMVDNTSSASVDAAAAGLTSPNKSYGLFIQGSLILPGIVPGTTRTVPGSAGVAALRAQVAATPSQNQAPAGQRWPLTRPIGFTTFFGPIPPAISTSGAFSQSDVNAMSSAGVNCFANFFGTLCLFGFVTPIPSTTDAIYWQATASCERMALVSEASQAMATYLFDTIDGAGLTLTAMQGDLQAIVQNHWQSGALYGDTAQAAGEVNTSTPVNTPATAAAGQLNAQLSVRISPFANTVNITISVIPLTQQIPQEVGT